MSRPTLRVELTHDEDGSRWLARSPGVGQWIDPPTPGTVSQM